MELSHKACVSHSIEKHQQGDGSIVPRVRHGALFLHRDYKCLFPGSWLIILCQTKENVVARGNDSSLEHCFITGGLISYEPVAFPTSIFLTAFFHQFCGDRHYGDGVGCLPWKRLSGPGGALHLHFVCRLFGQEGSLIFTVRSGGWIRSP